MATPTTGKYDRYLNKKFFQTSLTLFLVIALVVWSFIHWLLTLVT